MLLPSPSDLTLSSVFSFCLPDPEVLPLPITVDRYSHHKSHHNLLIAPSNEFSSESASLSRSRLFTRCTVTRTLGGVDLHKEPDESGFFRGPCSYESRT